VSFASVKFPDIGVTLLSCPSDHEPDSETPSDLMPDAATRLRSTWIPSQAVRYRAEGGPWRVPTLDQLISKRGGEVVDGDHRLSHPQMEELVASVAGGLAAQGIRRGDVVAWQLPNSIATAALYRACWRLGAIASPVLHSFGPADVVAALDQVDPTLVLEIDPECASDPRALSRILSGPPVDSGTAAVSPSDLAVVLFTSGSSGTPKAVLHTHRGLSWKASLMAEVHGLGRNDAVLMPAPMAHVAGLLNGVLVPGAAGMRAVLMRRFAADEALEQVTRHQVSFMAGPPTFFVAMAELLRSASRAHELMQSVGLISSGGAAVTPAFVEATAEAFDCRVKRTYGSTEAPTITTSTAQDPFEKARDTDGRTVGYAELRVSNPNSGQKMGPNEAGELWVRGPELFAGYANGAQNETTIARGGWFRTGDLATVDHEGWLRIVGRIKDVIIRGGENISAAEIEGALEAHPAIIQAIAVGYPDALMGERVAAVVVSSEPFDLSTCADWFRQRGMARYKTPERVVRLDALPLLGSGKPDRSAIQSLLVT
jgi:acyl-CoA synthetase (AMP-forming)/AMP-acid ligase II